MFAEDIGLVIGGTFFFVMLLVGGVIAWVAWVKDLGRRDQEIIDRAIASLGLIRCKRCQYRGPAEAIVQYRLPQPVEVLDFRCPSCGGTDWQKCGGEEVQSP